MWNETQMLLMCIADAGTRLYSGMKWNKMTCTHSSPDYITTSIDFIHLIYQFFMFDGIKARVCFICSTAAHGVLGDLIDSWNTLLLINNNNGGKQVPDLKCSFSAPSRGLKNRKIYAVKRSFLIADLTKISGFDVIICKRKLSMLSFMRFLFSCLLYLHITMPSTRRYTICK